MAFRKKDLVLTGDKAIQPRAGVPLNKESVGALLVKHAGNLTKVAKALGSTRQSVRRVINNDAALKEVLEEARERIIDDVEDAFIDKCLDGDTTSMIFFLKTRGRTRGYDQDFKQPTHDLTRAAFEFVVNKSKNPAE